MNLQHVRAMARKEWWHLLRDPRSLGLILLMPTMLLFFFGYAIRLDITDAPIGILQEAGDAASNELAARFEASHAFRIVSRYENRLAMRSALQAGRIWGGVIIPYSFARDLQRGAARVQLLLDGTDANSARLVRNYALNVVNSYARSLVTQAPPIEIQDRMWFNEARESRLAIVPGVIAVVMAVIGAFMTSLTMAKEIELGNLVMLRTAPLTRTEYLLGKLTPYFVIGMADLVMAVAAALFVFDVPLRGSFAALAVVSAIFLLVVMLQGALISIVAGNQLLASQMALVSTFLPAFLLSGFIYAIENMPAVIQVVTYIFPARYFVSILKGIFLKGIGVEILWAEVGFLLVYAAIVFGLATRRLKQKLA